MRDKPLVSIIVPVYNVQPYLRDCFNSLASQTYKNIEIILIDDGSTDGSGAICDELMTEEPAKTVVLHKENEGLSAARNVGLKIANGEWIAFVDSDDWVAPFFIEVMINAVLSTGCVIAAVPFGRSFRDGSDCRLAECIDDIAPPIVLSSYDVQKKMLYQELETGAQWHFFSRKTLSDNPFPEGLIFEDLASVYQFIHGVDAVAVVNSRDLYAYRLRSTSLVRQTYKPIKGQSALIVAEQLYRDICEWYPELSSAASSRVFSLCRMVFAQIPDKNDSFKQDRDAIWKVLAYHKNVVLHDRDARKRERLAAMFACLGKRAFSAFCSLCKKMGKM